VDFKAGTLTIPKMSPIKIVYHRTFKGSVRTVTISMTTTGKYFASILVENHAPLPKPSQEPREDKTVGIDMGLKTFAVLSNGMTFEAAKVAKQEKRHLKILQRKLSKKTKGSCSYRKIKDRIARLHERIANRRIDYIRKVASAIVSIEGLECICVEDLNVKGMMKNHHLAYSVADAGIGMFLETLEYLCKWNGIKYVEIGRFEPSSKLCHECGYKYKELKLNEREWTCPVCGHHHDRDFNAALNIKDIGLGLKIESRPVERGLVKPSEGVPGGLSAPVAVHASQSVAVSYDAAEEGKVRGESHPEAAKSSVSR
jgi:putative transposase